VNLSFYYFIVIFLMASVSEKKPLIVSLSEFRSFESASLFKSNINYAVGLSLVLVPVKHLNIENNTSTVIGSRDPTTFIHETIKIRRVQALHTMSLWTGGGVGMGPALDGGSDEESDNGVACSRTWRTPNRDAPNSKLLLLKYPDLQD